MKKKGISAQEVLRQLEFFRNPLRSIVLEKPCTIGDGIRVLSRLERERSIASAEKARMAGRFMKFIPASGASTRMFKSLLAIRNDHGQEITRAKLEAQAREGHGEAQEVLVLMDGLKRLPFFQELRSVMTRDDLDIEKLIDQGRFGSLVNYVLSSRGLKYAALPKLLMHFHRYPEGARIVLEDHLAAAADLLMSSNRLCRLHLSVSPSHLSLVEAAVKEKTRDYKGLYQCRYQVGISVQKESTDTIAVDSGNQLFRLKDGRLLFRPSGHGALIENINDLNTDILFINNVDNIVPDRLRKEITMWKKVLAGYLITTQNELFSHLSTLAKKRQTQKGLTEAVRFALDRLLIAPPAHRLSENELRTWLIDRLDRPLRVCGVVKNQGEPGGGPFWVRGSLGERSIQIVESAQVSSETGQQAILSSSTHFNPVDIVCGLRDWRGRSFNLGRVVDPSAAFITHRFHEGREIKGLERPGLWNGAMAGWNTILVEVPLSTFNPVKTINDLLRSNHQP